MANGSWETLAYLLLFELFQLRKFNHFLHLNCIRPTFLGKNFLPLNHRIGRNRNGCCCTLATQLHCFTQLFHELRNHLNKLQGSGNQLMVNWWLGILIRGILKKQSRARDHTGIPDIQDNKPNYPFSTSWSNLLATKNWPTHVLGRCTPPKTNSKSTGKKYAGNKYDRFLLGQKAYFQRELLVLGRCFYYIYSHFIAWRHKKSIEKNDMTSLNCLWKPKRIFRGHIVN